MITISESTSLYTLRDYLGICTPAISQAWIKAAPCSTMTFLPSMVISIWPLFGSEDENGRWIGIVLRLCKGARVERTARRRSIALRRHAEICVRCAEDWLGNAKESGSRKERTVANHGEWNLSGMIDGCKCATSSEWPWETELWSHYISACIRVYMRLESWFIVVLVKFLFDRKGKADPPMGFIIPICFSLNNTRFKSLDIRYFHLPLNPPHFSMLCLNSNFILVSSPSYNDSSDIPIAHVI